MTETTKIFTTSFFHNPISTWLWAGGITVFAFLFLKLVWSILHQQLQKTAAKTQTQLDDYLLIVFDHTKSYFPLILALNIGILILDLPDELTVFIEHISVILVLIQVAIWMNNVISAAINKYKEKCLAEDAAKATTISSVGFFSKILVWIIIVLLTLDNLGIDVNALIAGLGIGGIAVALAAQNVIGDVFASIAIVLDKPFVLGDFIIVGDYMGSIEYIGLKTTRLRSLSGEQIVFNNSDLLASRIRNYKRMFERRIVFTVGVLYQTPIVKLQAIPQIIQSIIEKQPRARFDRSHFKQFGSFSLDCETVYYVLSPDYKVYMDIQQAINLEIMKIFEHENIGFAYPTQTLFIQQEKALP